MPSDKIATMTELVAGRVAGMSATAEGSNERWQACVTLNAIIRGFRNYFTLDDAPTLQRQLRELDVTAVDALVSDTLRQEPSLTPFLRARERFASPTLSGDDADRAGDSLASACGAYIDAEDTGFLRRALVTTRAAERADAKPADRPSIAFANDGGADDVVLAEGRLHALGSGCAVGIAQDSLVVRRHRDELARIPLDDLVMLYLEGSRISLSADLTIELSQRDVPVIFTPAIGRPAAVAQSIHSLRSGVRQQQVLMRTEPHVVKAGIAMLAAKVANQASVLKYFARYRKKQDPDAFAALARCAEELREIAARLDALDPVTGVKATAMGHEGQAAAKYWGALARLVPLDLGFCGRVLRQAKDPVNAAINYVYGVLYGEVWRAVVRAGLDPYFGIMHGTERDQELVFDLIEEYRAPFGDRLVAAMIGRGLDLRLDRNDSLRTSTRHSLVRAFYRQWSRAVRAHGKVTTPAALETQISSLRQLFLGKGDYRPFRFRW